MYGERDQELLAEAYELVYEETAAAANSPSDEPNALQYVKQYRDLVAPLYREIIRATPNTKYIKEFLSRNSSMLSELFNGVEKFRNIFLNEFTGTRPDLKYAPDIHLIRDFINHIIAGDNLDPGYAKKILDYIIIFQSIVDGQLPNSRDPWNTQAPSLDQEVLSEFNRLKKYYTPKVLKSASRWAHTGADLKMR